jgi:hypothetical protein
MARSSARLMVLVGPIPHGSICVASASFIRAADCSTYSIRMFICMFYATSISVDHRTCIPLHVIWGGCAYAGREQLLYQIWCSICSGHACSRPCQRLMMDPSCDCRSTCEAWNGDTPEGGGGSSARVVVMNVHVELFLWSFLSVESAP